MCWLCVVAIEYVGKHIPMAFVERVKEDFHGGGNATTVHPTTWTKSLDTFGSLPSISGVIYQCQSQNSTLKMSTFDGFISWYPTVYSQVCTWK